MPQAKAKVIIVEDQTIFREMLAEILESRGLAQVQEQLSTGRPVVDRCLALQPDLVLLDAVLPDVPGLEVLRHLRHAHLNPRVILVTGHVKPALVHEAIERGVHGIVSKETALSELQLAVDRVMAGGRYYCSQTSTLISDAFSRPGTDQDLTPRQREIVQLIARGLSSKQIAEELGISLKTVSNHRLQLRERLGLKDVASLTRYAIEQGWVEPKA